MIVNYKDSKPKINKEASVFPSAVVAGDVTLDAKVNIWYNATVRGDMAPVWIKENTNIQDNAVVHTNTDLPTTIGRNVTVGHSAIVHAATVEDNALIGMGSIILDGAVIGEGSLVGAGAVVPPGKKVPPKSLVVGNPMKVVRELSLEEQEGIKQNAMEYLHLTANYEE